MGNSEAKNKIEKIVVNIGVGKMASQPNFPDKVLPEITKEISLITGQKPMFRSAKKSIAGFKLRQGAVIGLKTTLRRKRMAEFIKKLIKIALPRVRDFRGINPASIDSNGNLTIGVKEHLVFPEVSPELSKANFGLEITLVPKTRIQERSKAAEFYKNLGIPFKK